MFKKIIGFIIAAIFSVNTVLGAAPQIDGKSAILMEASTGKILAEQNADEALPPASVTKVMTLLLIYDSVAEGKIKWEDNVTVSEHAASMGGSQIFLEPNETQTVADLTKSIAIASANDAAVAMAEFIGGSEEAFVEKMNERAKGLGMTTANFENACGLDSANHKLSAKDIALMSRELITKYPDIHKYTQTWQDTITHKTAKGTSEFGLTNTNKLIKWYENATGLKTGSTSEAKFCLSATAKKDDMELIAVVMAAPDPKTRFREAMKYLDYGFANYGIKKGKAVGEVIGEIPVNKGEENSVKGLVETEITALVSKGDKSELTSSVKCIDAVNAPVKKGDKLGEIIYYSQNEEVGRSNIIAEKDIEKAGLIKNISNLANKWFN